MITTYHTDDYRLLEGILVADSHRIREVYDLALPAVVHWVCNNNGTEADARDVFQEAIMALFRKLEGGDFTLTCTLKSFLRVMCRNLWINQLRKQQWIHPKSYEDLHYNQVAEEGGGIDWLTQSERDHLFFKHFDALNEKCQYILKGFFAKIPLREIAQQLGSTENYIKKRKFICKQQLLKNIQKDPLYKELKMND